MFTFNELNQTDVMVCTKVKKELNVEPDDLFHREPEAEEKYRLYKVSSSSTATELRSSLLHFLL